MSLATDIQFASIVTENLLLELKFHNDQLYYF